MNKLNIFIIGLLFAMAVFSGCHKEKLECEEFCLYANVEDFYKTAPFINEYLSTLPKSWRDKRKMQSLTEWLNSFPCIMNAELASSTPKSSNFENIVSKSPYPEAPPVVWIAIELEENGIKRGLTMSITKKNSLLIAQGYIYSNLTEVVVSTGYDVNVPIKQVFDFINLFDHKVPYIQIFTGSYTSTMPPSNLQSILDSLNAKPYVYAHGFIDFQRIVILPTLYSMDNKNYQADWLRTVDNFQLFEWNYLPIEHGYNIYFEVPAGKEEEWIAKFEKYEIVEMANRVIRGKTMLL